MSMAVALQQSEDTHAMDSEDEFDEHATAGHAPSNLRERRRAQKVLFESWLTSEAAQQSMKQKTKEGKLRDAADEELSIHTLMAKDGTRIINSPRDYQLELLERAKHENTIAVLDTGSGKTLIAVMLLRHVIDQELEDRAKGRAPRISFFLVASKAKWAKLFDDNKVIVCTADILLQCLTRSYITLKQVNLLIFDEAHHAKKNHAYARIIKDHYLGATDSTSRPRVFGMTASPIDAKTDVDQAAIELETLLHSKIATTNDMSFTPAVKRPAESVMRYAALPRPYETKILQDMKAKYGHVEAFRVTFQKCPDIARELGSWCSDQYLHDALDEKRLKKYENRVEHRFYSRGVNRDVKELDVQQENVRSAMEYLSQRFVLHTIAKDQEQVSSKVLALRSFLAEQYERPTSHRCIVFVEKRHTARLLHTLFKRIGSPNMRSAYLTGNNGKDIQDSVSFRQQILTLRKFRLGEYNCLFTTSVAEEGLDIPDCNLVVRFDTYRTMIQYVQSRGRARQRNSKFIHMIENGNSVHEHVISEVRSQESAMRSFCSRLPEDRMLIGQTDTLESLLEKEKNLKVFVDPVSGAKLTYNNCLGVLANYVAVLPTENDEPMYPAYVVSSEGSKFIAEVLLPAGCAIRSTVGRVHTKKTLAKRSAAFEACFELRKHGHLDDNLMSTQRRRANLLRNAELALSMNSSNQYLMQKKPKAWSVGRGVMPTELWVTLIDFPDGLERKHVPLALLTRTPMPQLPSYPLYLNDSRESYVSSFAFEKSIEVDQLKMQKLTDFVFTVFQDVFSKKFQRDGASLSYWLCPAKLVHGDMANRDVEHILDWKLLDDILATDSSSWTPKTPKGTLVDRYFIDPWDGGKKYITHALDCTLKPLDPPPAGAATYKHDNTINWVHSEFVEEVQRESQLEP